MEKNIEDRIERLVERKVQEKLDEKTNQNKQTKTENKEVTRRNFLKKIGAGAIGLGALTLTPNATAIDIKDPKGLQVYESGTKYLDIQPGGPVQIKNTKLLEKGKRIATRNWVNNTWSGNWSTNGNRDLTVHGQRAMVGYNNGKLTIGYNGDFTQTDIQSPPLTINGNTVWHQGNDGPNSGLNADTIDSWHKADIQNWVNNNADVPNADNADTAGDADTIDGLHSSQFVRSDTNDSTSGRFTVNGDSIVISTYSTKSDVPKDLPEGAVVYVSDEASLYVEDGT